MSEFKPSKTIKNPKDGDYWAVNKIYAGIKKVRQEELAKKLNYICTSQAENGEPIEYYAQLVEIYGGRVYYRTYILSSNKLEEKFKLTPTIHDDKLENWWIVRKVQNPFESIKKRVRIKTKKIIERMNKLDKKKE